jgi:hypothetical protein
MDLTDFGGSPLGGPKRCACGCSCCCGCACGGGGSAATLSSAYSSDQSTQSSAAISAVP